MHLRWLAWLGLCLVGCFTPGPPPPPASADPRAGIAEGNRLLAAALEVGNPDRIATVFADDATLLVVHVPVIHGHVAIADYWRARLATTRFIDVEFTTAELYVAGDLAYEIGTSRAKTQSGEAPPVVSTGRYLAVWRLGGGSRWRIEADSFLPDAAP